MADDCSGRDQAAPIAGWWSHIFGKRNVPEFNRKWLFVLWLDGEEWLLALLGEKETLFFQGVCVSTLILL